MTEDIRQHDLNDYPIYEVYNNQTGKTYHREHNKIRIIEVPGEMGWVPFVEVRHRMGRDLLRFAYRDATVLYDMGEKPEVSDEEAVDRR